MSDESPPKFPTSKDPAQPETSLSDLLPEFFETPPANQNSGPLVQSTPDRSATPEVDNILIPFREVPVKSRQKGFNYVPLAIAAVVGIIIVPLLIFGVFVFIANNQPARTTIDVAQASTPLATVFSITPGPANLTPAPVGNGTTVGNGTVQPSAAAAKSPVVNQCPAQVAFGSVELYSCSRLVQAGGDFTTYFGLAEVQLAQTGQNGPAANRVYAVSGDSPAKVLQFYATSLVAQGYTLARPADTGTTSLGPYSAALYVKSSQQVQVAVLTVNKASPDGQVNAGQTLIRLSST